METIAELIAAASSTFVYARPEGTVLSLLFKRVGSWPGDGAQVLEADLLLTEGATHVWSEIHAPIGASSSAVVVAYFPPGVAVPAWGAPAVDKGEAAMAFGAVAGGCPRGRHGHYLWFVHPIETEDLYGYSKLRAVLRGRLVAAAKERGHEINTAKADMLAEGQWVRGISDVDAAAIVDAAAMA